MSSLGRIIARRKALRIFFEKTLFEAKEYLEGPECTEARLIGLKGGLTDQTEQLNSVDEDIVNALDPADVEADVLDSLKILEPSREVIAGLELKINALKLNDSEIGSVKSTSSSTTGRCKLPKLELPVFEGDPLQWQGFWDQFNVSIHQNEGISDVDRFNYLKRYLKGKALSTVTGLALSSDNYKEAINLLVERFGNPQVLISAHLDALIKVKKVTSLEHLESLRKMYNEVETCVRNLKSLKVETATYGCLLIPILKEKLPRELLMIISRKFGVDLWTLEEFLKHFNDELQAKESCMTFSSTDKNEKSVSGGFTTAGSLLAQSIATNSSFVLKCVYCLNKHPSSQCDKIRGVAERLKILKRFSKCFICLKGGHVAKKCTASYICRKCNGRHHISICGKVDDNKGDDKGNESAANFVGDSKDVVM